MANPHEPSIIDEKRERPIDRFIKSCEDTIQEIKSAMKDESKKVTGKDKSYAYNMPSAIRKFRKREADIEYMKKLRAEKYLEEYQEKMRQLKDSIEDKHRVNDYSLIKKHENL
jgi:hypothetical protein